MIGLELDFVQNGFRNFLVNKKDINPNSDHEWGKSTSIISFDLRITLRTTVLYSLNCPEHTELCVIVASTFILKK